MATEPKLTASEIAEQGERIYNEQLRDKVEPGNFGRLIAIDIHSAQYQIADNLLDAVDRLRAIVPQAEAYTIKIGYPATAVIGGRLHPNRPRIDKLSRER